MQISLNFLSGDEAATPPLSQDASPSTVVKRRPGRPRLRPVGPANQGGRQPKSLSADGVASSGKRGGRRGAPTGPRVIKPLPVPIGSMTTNKQAGEGVRASSSPFVPSTSAASTNPRPPGPSIYGPMSPWDEKNCCSHMSTWENIVFVLHFKHQENPSEIQSSCFLG